MERPILFSGPMVRAILDGGKTQTRRIVKDSPVYVTTFIGRDNKPTGEFGIHLTHDRVINKHVRCPYGQPGDRLWVRETWGDPWHHAQPRTLYRADEEIRHPEFDGWKPSIHMRRERSRLTLEVGEVRVERLQDISEEDARAEGVEPKRPAGSAAIYEGPIHLSHVVAFRELWCVINGAESWDANPWVWVVGFKVAEVRR